MSCKLVICGFYFNIKTLLSIKKLTIHISGYVLDEAMSSESMGPVLIDKVFKATTSKGMNTRNK